MLWWTKTRSKHESRMHGVVFRHPALGSGAWSYGRIAWRSLAQCEGLGFTKMDFRVLKKCGAADPCFGCGLKSEVQVLKALLV